MIGVCVLLVWLYLCVIVYCGVGKLVFENMFVVFCYGVLFGYCMFEFDVKFFGDGVLVLLYDVMLDCIMNGVGCFDVFMFG